MSRKIKFHSFHVLFRLFAFLADKSGGWRVFVLPKLLLGSLIVGLGLSGCGAKTNKGNSETSKNGLLDTIKRVEVNLDSTALNEQPLPLKSTLCYFTAPVIKKENKFSKSMISCYDTEVISNSTDTVKEIEVMDHAAEFPGGNDSLLTFVSKNLKWPNTEADVQGKVICRFVVNTDGSISEYEVIQSLHPLFDIEAIRVIKLLPKFITGKQNGKPVRSYYVIPIAFKLE